VSTDELLARLARLDERDRAWLLAELPSALRHELAGILTDDDFPEAPPGNPEPVAAGWEALNPVAVAAVLAAEPVWLASAATRSADPRWRERVLQALAPRRRHEIEIADRTGGPLSARAAQCVLEGCRTRIATGAANACLGPRSGFAALVEQMRSRFA
jgi:hypothetical protein